MDCNLTRRGFLKETAWIGMATTALNATGRAGAAPQPKGTLPKIKLGDLEVSRLILGSNPFFGFSHQGKEKDEEMREYYTDERIMAVLDEAAALGVTAVAAPPYERWIALFAKYIANGGKIRIWIAQPDVEPEKMKTAIADAAQGGAKAIFVQGACVERQFRENHLDVLKDWVEYIRSFNLPAGLASHRPDVHLVAEEKGFPTDFYFQCFFQPGAEDTYHMEDRKKAVATIRKIDKPVVAYKILAAGRLSAEEGFEFAFKHLREKDGVCVGVYPNSKSAMMEEDVALAVQMSRIRSK
ncbi:MAG TPA: hypothetical protein PK395_13010 [bacterium]|nr:hypothetical protein [bacterium]